MLLDAKQRPWIVATSLLAVAATVVYFVDAPRHLTGPSGSTAVGLTLGIIAYGIMLFCAALGLKRRVPHWRLGRAQTWLRAHVWLGLLIVVLVALHAAFALGGPFTAALWVMLILVTVSGLVGIFIQQSIPRVLLHSLRPLPSMNPESPAQQVKEMILYAGEPRYLLYGTDWPICRMRTYLKFVNELGLPPETKELILWKNTAQLFKLKIGQANDETAKAPQTGR